MRLYLIRHGRAENAGPDGSDASRRLSPDGVARWVESVRGLRAQGVTLDLVLSSPLARAQQTAMLLAQHLPAPAPVVLPALGIPPEPMPELIARLGAEGESVAAVGHEPTMGHLASFLLFGAVSAAIPMPRGAVACLRFEGRAAAGFGTLEFLAPGRLLRREG